MATAFYKLGGKITGNTGLSFRTQSKSFKTHFGVNPHTCLVIYEKIKTQFSVVISREYFLWTLYFLCCYPKVKVMRKIFGVDVKTFRKHTSNIIWYLKRLNIVSNVVQHVHSWN